MTLNANQPTDQALNALWPSYIREDRVDINSMWSIVGSGIVTPDYTPINMTAGQTSLNITDDLSSGGVEVVALTADAAVNLTTIVGGKAGQIKIIIMLDDNITFIQNTGLLGGSIYLNSPVGVNFDAAIRDVTFILNIGGDGVTVNGYWLELHRKLHI